MWLPGNTRVESGNSTISVDNDGKLLDRITGLKNR
jgi:hypothetical protein